MLAAPEISNFLAVGFSQIKQFDRYDCVYVNELIANIWHLVILGHSQGNNTLIYAKKNGMGGKIGCDVHLRETAAG